ncbi:hypothetical protein [Aestuariibacter salexigens]|uniref:hypothetical protein n=1 Tax=Aestuariibacter salexigens TaxID=226010 RepID=UPI0012EBFE07|nr:hypothetical protein [Aestuariibacter salexigens]
MNATRSALALSIACLLSACGGSDDAPTASVSVPTPAPTPSPTPTPTPSSSDKDGVFTGSASETSSTAALDTTAVIAPDGNAVIIVGAGQAVFKVDLQAGENGTIDIEGVRFSDNQTVTVSGTTDGQSYELDINNDGELLYELMLSKDAQNSDNSSSLTGYYTLSDSEFTSAAVVLEDGMLKGNDALYCQYSGTYSGLATNVVSVDVEISDLAPLSCPNKGSYQGLASLLNADAGVMGSNELLLALYNDQGGFIRPVIKSSEDPVVPGLPAGLYSQTGSPDYEDISFAVSHDGQMTGAITNKLLSGYFNATPVYTGAGYVFYDDFMRYFNKSSYLINQGYLLIADSDWQQLFVQSDSQATDAIQSSSADVVLGLTDFDTYRYETTMAMYKHSTADYPIQFSQLAGRYVPENGDIDVTVNADGSFSGTHHSCNVEGIISERSDTPVQEFSIEFTRSECPGSNNFSKDGPYQGFGFASNNADDGSWELSLFTSGFTDVGKITNLLTFKSSDKQ